MSRPDGAEPLDPSAILTALGLGAPLVVERVAGGSDTAIWRVRSGERQSALRVFRAGEEERARQELAALELAAAGGLTVPAVERQTSWRQRPVVLLGGLPGGALTHACARAPLRAWAWPKSRP